MTRLAEVIAGIGEAGDAYRVEAPAAWAQGRTLYGGMTTALCFAAARRVAPDMSLKSAQVLFAGPASGQLTLAPQVLRVGKSSAAVTVSCSAEAGIAAVANFAFGAERDSAIDRPAASRPLPVEAPEDYPAFITRTGGFHDRFELRLAEGSALMSGGAPEFSAWVRFREPHGTVPMTALLALADALPPAAMACFPERAPISTIAWSIDLLGDPGALDGWHLLRSASEQTRGGYSTQAMDLWDARGRPLATGRQLVAIFI